METACPACENSERTSGEPEEERGEDTATLIVSTPGRANFQYRLDGRNTGIGRSAKVGNAIVLEDDVLCSKRHAALERDRDGRYTLYDLGSTNGTTVNGLPIDNRTLCDADEIRIGQSRLLFQQTMPLPATPWAAESLPGVAIGPESRAPGVAPPRESGEQDMDAGADRTPVRLFRLVLMDLQEETRDFLLDTETLAGRSETNDIVLSDRSVAAQHARLFYEDGGYHLEPLHDSAFATVVNGRPLLGRQSVPLLEGDRIQMGDLVLRFAKGIRVAHFGASSNIP